MTDSRTGIQSMGGKARAQKLSKEERREIAREAALARWKKDGKPVPRATHEGMLVIGDMEIPCAVLQDGRRVLSENGITNAILGSRSGASKRLKKAHYERGAHLPLFIAPSSLKSFISDELLAGPLTPINYSTKTRMQVGFEASILPTVCEIWLSARAAGKLQRQQLDKAQKAEILMRGLAHVGIIALIDEATGFQYERPRRDLEEYLKKFLSESVRRWVRTFPNDYFKHLCRLKNVPLRPDMKLPQYFGHLTNDLVWRRIAPGVLKALKERRSERGRPSNKLHSWTSDDLGKPELLLHLGTVVGLMKMNTDYAVFYAQLNKVAPIYPDNPTLFDDPKDWEKPR